MRAVALVLSMSLLIPVAAVSAQARPAVRTGERVRVTAPRLGLRNETGIYQWFSDGIVAIVPDGSVDSWWRIEFASITRLHVHRGQRSMTASGLLFGALIGAAAGGFITMATGDETGGSSVVSREKVAAMLAVVGGVVGGVCGAAIGASVRTDKWEEVPLHRLRVSLAPQRDGRFGIGLTIAF